VPARTARGCGSDQRGRCAGCCRGRCGAFGGLALLALALRTFGGLAGLTLTARALLELRGDLCLEVDDASLDVELLALERGHQLHAALELVAGLVGQRRHLRVQFRGVVTGRIGDRELTLVLLFLHPRPVRQVLDLDLEHGRPVDGLGAHPDATLEVVDPVGECGGVVGLRDRLEHRHRRGGGRPPVLVGVASDLVEQHHGLGQLRGCEHQTPLGDAGPVTGLGRGLLRRLVRRDGPGELGLRLRQVTSQLREPCLDLLERALGLRDQPGQLRGAFLGRLELRLGRDRPRLHPWRGHEDERRHQQDADAPTSGHGPLHVVLREQRATTGPRRERYKRG
jgi:hypothetical protein